MNCTRLAQFGKTLNKGFEPGSFILTYAVLYYAIVFVSDVMPVYFQQ